MDSDYRDWPQQYRQLATTSSTAFCIPNHPSLLLPSPFVPLYFPCYSTIFPFISVLCHLLSPSSLLLHHLHSSAVSFITFLLHLHHPSSPAIFISIFLYLPLFHLPRPSSPSFFNSLSFISSFIYFLHLPPRSFPSFISLFISLLLHLPPSSPSSFISFLFHLPPPSSPSFISLLLHLHLPPSPSFISLLHLPSPSSPFSFISLLHLPLPSPSSPSFISLLHLPPPSSPSLSPPPCCHASCSCLCCTFARRCSGDTSLSRTSQVRTRHCHEPLRYAHVTVTNLSDTHMSLSRTSQVRTRHLSRTSQVCTRHCHKPLRYAHVTHKPHRYTYVTVTNLSGTHTSLSRTCQVCTRLKYACLANINSIISRSHSIILFQVCMHYCHKPMVLCQPLMLFGWHLCFWHDVCCDTLRLCVEDWGCVTLSSGLGWRFSGLMTIGRASLARENEAGGSWGQEVHLLHVNI